MQEAPTAPQPPVEGPTPGPPGDMAPLPAGPKRSRWKNRNFIPVVLAVLGLVLGLWGFGLLPSVAAELPTPDYPQLIIHTPFSLSNITYDVEQVNSAVAKVTITVVLSSRIPPPDTAQLTVELPYPDTFLHCRAACTTTHGIEFRNQQLHVMHSRSPGAQRQAATARFLVKARNFGLVSNGLAASAVLPSVTYAGPPGPSGAMNPQFLVGYRSSSAASYAWSGPLAKQPGASSVAWGEQLANGVTPDVPVGGISPGAQSHDNSMIFLAGVLIALGGAMILAAFLEAVHLRDWHMLDTAVRHLKEQSGGDHAQQRSADQRPAPKPTSPDDRSATAKRDRQRPPRSGSQETAGQDDEPTENPWFKPGQGTAPGSTTS